MVVALMSSVKLKEDVSQWKFSFAAKISPRIDRRPEEEIFVLNGFIYGVIKMIANVDK